MTHPHPPLRPPATPGAQAEKLFQAQVEACFDRAAGAGAASFLAQPGGDAEGGGVRVPELLRAVAPHLTAAAGRPSDKDRQRLLQRVRGAGGTRVPRLFCARRSPGASFTLRARIVLPQGYREDNERKLHRFSLLSASRDVHHGRQALARLAASSPLRTHPQPCAGLGTPARAGRLHPDAAPLRRPHSQLEADGVLPGTVESVFEQALEQLACACACALACAAVAVSGRGFGDPAHCLAARFLNVKARAAAAFPPLRCPRRRGLRARLCVLTNRLTRERPAATQPALQVGPLIRERWAQLAREVTDSDAAQLADSLCAPGRAARLG